MIHVLSFQIAPYWIQTPPTIVSLTVNQPLQLSASALGIILLYERKVENQDIII